jgi:hypothetical protein
MKLITNYKRKSINEDRELEITFSIPAYQAKLIETLEKSKQYDIEINEYKSNRTKKQNRAMWLLLGEIDKVMNGGKRTRTGDEELYCDALERANIKYDVKPVEVSMVDIIKKAKGVRGLKILEQRNVNNVEFYICKIYFGSSKFTTKEMYDLMEIILDMASEEGLDIEYWEGQFEFKRRC